MCGANINSNSEYQLISRPTTKLENLALSVNRNYLTNIFVSTVILIIPCIVSLFTNPFSTNKRIVILFCISVPTRSYMLSRDM
jgi:ABC-type multidrug transport system fused ATPase/permease subunit